MKPPNPGVIRARPTAGNIANPADRIERARVPGTRDQNERQDTPTRQQLKALDSLPLNVQKAGAKRNGR